MRCPERRAAARTIDFGARIALDAASQESTVFDAIPMGRANAITVSLVVASMPVGAGSIDILASNDDENYTSLSSTFFNLPGIYSLQALQVAFAYVRVGMTAQGFSGKLIAGLSAQTGNI